MGEPGCSPAGEAVVGVLCSIGRASMAAAQDQAYHNSSIVTGVDLASLMVSSSEDTKHYFGLRHQGKLYHNLGFPFGKHG